MMPWIRSYIEINLEYFGTHYGGMLFVDNSKKDDFNHSCVGKKRNNERKVLFTFFFFLKKTCYGVRDLKDLIFVLTRELVVPMHHGASIILLAWKVC